MINMYRPFLVCFCLMCACLPSHSQDTPDSTDYQRDSIIQVLLSQIQEMKIQQIILQEELYRTGENARLDSVAQLQRRQRIDSLRKVTPGAPLVIEGDTLFKLYARSGGEMAEVRVKEARDKIIEIGRSLTFLTDSIYVFEGDYSSDIMAGDEVLLSITDMDGLWQDKSRSELAHDYSVLIQAKIDKLHSTYGLKQKLWGLLFAVLIIIVQWVAIKLTVMAFEKWKFRATRYAIKRLHPISLKDYEFLGMRRQGIFFLTLYNALRYAFIILQLFVSVTLIFSIFPETKTLIFTVFGYIWNPFKDIVWAVINYLPNIFKIAVIWVCFHYLVKTLSYFTNEIESGRLKINGFYADWAHPTYYILRVLFYSLMFVMIWPLLPNSDSEIFQGVSVFIGIIVSLGSSAIIGNIMAGMVMTYMRPFRIGDYIKVGDTVGEVIEKTVLVTRIRTRKNEVVTIQNSNLMGSQTSNYTVAAKNYKLIVHTKVTIGYDVPWQKVREIMEGAAHDTEGILKNPKPFMMTTALDDFYVEYEINAFTSDAINMPRIYSNLHQNLLKRFFDAGVEIMSPHIYARRDGIDVQMPSEYHTGEAEK